jgi:hypothetical protein
MEPLEMTEPWSSVDEAAKHQGAAQGSRSWLRAHKVGRLGKLQPPDVEAWALAGGEEAEKIKTAKVTRGCS